MSQFAPVSSTDQRCGIMLFPWLAFAAIECAALAVFWAFDALPFMDLPGHAGVIALRSFYPQSDFLQQYFRVAPHFGAYSLFRFIGDSLAPWIGPVAAVRVLASLPIIGVPLAILYARYRLCGDVRPFFAYAALILSFGFMTIMGFASYMLAIAIFVVALAEWLVLLRHSSATVSSEIGVALLSALLFISHGFAFFIFVLLATATVVSDRSCIPRFARLRALGPAVVLLCYSLWTEHSERLPETPSAELTFRFQGLADKLSLLATPTLVTRTGIDILIGILIWVAVVVAVAKSWHSSARSGSATATQPYVRALSLASLASLCIFFVLPHSIGWFGFVDGRVLPLTLLIGLLAIDPDIFSQRTQSLATATAGLAAVLTVALLFVASYQFQDEASGYAETLASVPEESRLLYLPLEPDSRIFVGHPFVHFDKLVLTQRPIIPSDLWFHQGTAIYPTKINPILQLPAEYSSSDLKTIIWPHYKLDDWHYVLIRLGKGSAPLDTPPGLSAVSHHGGWWLYRTSRQLPDARVNPRQATMPALTPEQISTAKSARDFVASQDPIPSQK